MRRVVRDTCLVFLRSIRPTLRNPVLVVFGAAQPALFLILLGPLLGGFGGTSAAWQWFVPGLIIQMALFGTSYAGYTLMPELRSGILERLRVTPVSRTALLLGRILRDVLVLLLQCVVLLALSTVFGFRASAGEVALVLLFAALTGVWISASSYALAMKLRHEYVFGPMLGSTVMPLMLLSGILLPMDRGPDWLYALSRISPLSYVVEGLRSVVDGAAGTTAVLTAALVTAGMLVLCLLWGVRTFQRGIA